ncbi:YkuS family protein [Geosporobacter ferrireducens]|uniref:YkuS family protein n=1 Tax=Geosporobacter ferrireducens TaxID=1424294 RepID=A0A1D8GC28_9FIRM|nr:YkuS family protein [Geosporobacter ferrireducens]AOT68484.1 hypothetical protein Gferi_02080 [Geosporobacter ferrireducens]MTI53946.1 hypothetical protein [Geosporobacter ferrireducens]
MLGKVVAVQSGLDSIANKLRNKGYYVTDFNGTSEPIDAMIYSEQVGYQTPPEITSSRILLNNQYVVMLNADELEEDEIINRVDAIR